MTLEQISAMTLDSCFNYLLHQLVDFSSVPAEQELFSYEEGEESLYSRLILHQSLVKPSLQAFEDALAAYKVELTIVEEARLAEIARIADINSRWNAINDIHGAIYKAGYSISNPGLEQKRIIDENDTQRLEEYEQASTLLAQDVAQAQINEQSRKYLASTDWYIIRETETGIPCPAEIKTQRTAARLAIVE